MFKNIQIYAFLISSDLIYVLEIHVY